MRSIFPLFQSHLDLAKSYWQKLLTQGDVVIDATAGNGYDSLTIATMILPKGNLYIIDIQKQAIIQTQRLLQEKLSGEQLAKISFICDSHVNFPSQIKENSIKGIVYNLGYLPGSDKKIMTHANETLMSIKQGLSLIKEGGFISLTCYPGHPDGEIESLAITEFCKSLDPKIWSICEHHFLNRIKSPKLIFLQKFCL